MAEQIVAEYSQKMPICIVRPSIVTGSISEPYPGWVDNAYNVTGIMMEIGRGTISSAMCEGNYIADLIPVDIVANTMIAAGWANSFTQYVLIIATEIQPISHVSFFLIY
jgi:alcohol-forming fatty acyl-CoA reductase